MQVKPGQVIVLGEVLIDVFPNNKRLGGAPFNFAFHLHSLGIPVIFISRVGEDESGREILAFAKNKKLPTRGIQIDHKRSTGMVKVTVKPKGEPEFEIIKDRAWDYIDYSPYLQSILKQDVSLVYYGSLAQRSPRSFETIQKVLQTTASRAVLMMDLNLRPPFYDRKTIETSLKFCDILKVSGEELGEVKNLLNVQGTGPELIKHLQENYGIELICVTRGSSGSELHEKGNPEPVTQPAHETGDVEDTVGAGDIFSAMLAAGIIKGWPNKATLERASLFASKICTIKGALPKEANFYKYFPPR